MAIVINIIAWSALIICAVFIYLLLLAFLAGVYACSEGKGKRELIRNQGTWRRSFTPPLLFLAWLTLVWIYNSFLIGPYFICLKLAFKWKFSAKPTKWHVGSIEFDIHRCLYSTTTQLQLDDTIAAKRTHGDISEAVAELWRSVTAPERENGPTTPFYCNCPLPSYHGLSYTARYCWLR